MCPINVYFWQVQIFLTHILMIRYIYFYNCQNLIMLLVGPMCTGAWVVENMSVKINEPSQEPFPCMKLKVKVV